MKFEKEDVLLNVNVNNKESLLEELSKYAQKIGFTKDPEGLVGSFKSIQLDYKMALQFHMLNLKQ